MSRLPTGMTTAGRMEVVTFISCVGIIMNGDYMEYNQLTDLITHSSCTLSQGKLQKLQIQPRFYLAKVYNVMCPYPFVCRLFSPQGRSSSHRRRSLRRSSSSRMRLTCRQLRIRRESGQWRSRLPKQAYEMYLAICKKHNVMMRTFRSFQQKRKTLMSGK